MYNGSSNDYVLVEARAVDRLAFFSVYGRVGPTCIQHFDVVMGGAKIIFDVVCLSPSLSLSLSLSLCLSAPIRPSLH